MKLTELDPGWAITEKGRSGMGVSFKCPCCLGADRATYLLVWFGNPIDGGMPSPSVLPKPRWQRTGDTFETLTLTPSVDADSPLLDENDPSKGKVGHWHGFITNGEIK